VSTGDVADPRGSDQSLAWWLREDIDRHKGGAGAREAWRSSAGSDGQSWIDL
jgi:hypothetical protein